jgi:hypothetical protein
MNPLRRKTDQRSHSSRLAEMTSEERQAAHLAGLSREVGRACDEWLLSRGVTPPRFNPDASQTILTPSTGTPDDDQTPTGGTRQSHTLSHPTPNDALNFFAREITEKRGNQDPHFLNSQTTTNQP